MAAGDSARLSQAGAAEIPGPGQHSQSEHHDSRQNRPLPHDPAKVDSRFKRDTELQGEGLQGGLEGEAFAGRGIEGQSGASRS